MAKHVDFQKNCFISIGTILLYFFWPSILRAFWEVFGGSTEASLDFMVYEIFGYIILVGLLFAIYYKSLKKEWSVFWKKRKECIIDIIKYVVILFVGVIVFNFIVQSIFGMDLTQNEVHLYEQFKKTPFLMVIMVTIYYPIVEVIVFQKTIRQVIKKPWLYILISAIFFGYFNIAFTEFTLSNVIGSVQYILFNAVLAFTYYKKDTIVVPIGIKMFYNFIVSILSII